MSDTKFPETSVHETLLGIRFDLYLINHALKFEEEMPQEERGGAYFSINRIIERFDEVLDKAEGDLMGIPIA